MLGGTGACQPEAWAARCTAAAGFVIVGMFVVTWLGADGQPGLELGICDTGQLALRCRRADGTGAELRSAEPLNFRVASVPSHDFS